MPTAIDTTTRVVHIKDNVPGSFYIGRANRRAQVSESVFANRFVIGKHGTREQVIRMYEVWINQRRDLWWGLPILRGKPLACWCRHDGEAKTPDNACHGDVLIDLLNRYTDAELTDAVAAGRAPDAEGESE